MALLDVQRFRSEAYCVPILAAAALVFAGMFGIAFIIHMAFDLVF